MIRGGTKQNSQEMLYLSLISLTAQAAIASVNLALIYFLRASFNLSSQMIGFSAAAYTISYFIFCSIVDPVASKVHPSTSIIISMIGMAASTFAVLYLPKVWMIFPALILYGFFMAFLWPQLAGWISRGKEGHALSRATGAFNVSWSIGVALSPLITGFLVEIDPSAALKIFIASFLFVAVITAVFTTITPEMKRAVSEHANRKNHRGEDNSTPLRFASWVGNLTVYVVLAVILTIFPLYALDSLPYRTASVGFLLFIRGAITVVVFIFMGRTRFWHFKGTLVALTLIAASVLTFTARFIHSLAGYLMFFVMFGALFAAMYSFSIFHGFSGSINRTRRMLIHESLLTVGTVIGNTFGASLYQYYGFSSVLLFCSVLLLVPIPLLFIRDRVKISL